MRVPLSWLKEFVALDDLSVEQVAETLTVSGLEVEKIEHIRPPFSGVVVGRVVTCEQHPDAEKLRVAQITDGQEEYQVVCGAPNCREGLVTAFARVGARLGLNEEKPFKIRKSKIRGVESHGMLCSEVELGLGGDEDGIIELPADRALGGEVGLESADSVLEISLTPNLAHCMSIYGVARDLGAVLGRPLSAPPDRLPTESGAPIDDEVAVEVTDPKGCPRYDARLVRNVVVGSSPDWLRQCLEKAGLRSVNNVVDVTNYVMLELGHPLHAFDFSQINGGKIIVRTARESESFTALDGREHRLESDDLVICDAERPVALAGVMGSSNSEVGDDTTCVLLEAAYFDPKRVRRTARRVGLLTDSAARFERGVDPNGMPRALRRAAELLETVASGKVAPGIVDVVSETFTDRAVDVRLSRASDLLGITLVQGELEDIFSRLGFPTEWKDDDRLCVCVPAYRHDLTIEADLIEEVARIYGYDKLPRKAGRSHSSELSSPPIYLFEKELRNRLIALGLQEFLTSDLVGPGLLDRVVESATHNPSLLQIANPTSVDQSILRPSLLPGLLEVVSHNLRHQVPNICGFEIGRTYGLFEGRRVETPMVGIVMTGSRSLQHWSSDVPEIDFFDAKGVLEQLFAGLGISGDRLRAQESNEEVLHPQRQAYLVVDDVQLAVLGEVHPSILRAFDIKQRVYFASCDLEDLLPLRQSVDKMRPIPAFPASERDWTLTLREEVPVAQVAEALAAAAPPLLEEAVLITVYRSEKLGSDRKNVTFRFRYRDTKKTISQNVVEKQHASLCEKVLTALGSNVMS